ncbi:MAG: phosphotransferase [Candidatus Merdivicinus sp.]|jgi:homoserine kinase type II
MAVKTHLSLNEIRSMLERYPVGKVFSASEIQAGTVQSNFRIEAEMGTYVLRLYESRTMEQVSFEAALIRKLTACGFPTPKLVEAENRRIHSILGKPYCLYAFAKGTHVSVLNRQQEESLIQTMAELARITRSLHLPGKETRISYQPDCMEKLACQKAECLGTENAVQKFAWYQQQLRKLILPDGMAMGICHCDYDLSNILFHDGKVSALLDFDDANYTWALFDFASSTNFFRKDFSHESWNQFQRDDPILDFTEARRRMAIYIRHCEVSKTDRLHLFDLAKLGILVDCIWYFERGEWQDFYERRKIEALDAYGRDHFYQSVFGELQYE